MKILTIASPRSGGKYFTEYLANRYNLTHYHEPEMNGRLDNILSKNNISVKLVTSHLYYYYHLEMGISIDESISIICDRVSKFKFDKVYLLDRYHTDEYIEALINLKLRQENNHVDWVYNEQFKKKHVTKSNIEYFKGYAEESTRWINMISDKLSIDVIYYDDLYYKSDTIDLQGLKFIPDLSKRLRKELLDSNKLI